MPTIPIDTPVLADQMQQTKDRMRDDFVSTMDLVGKINPDQYAKATQISRLSGVDPETLNKNMPTVEASLKSNRYAEVFDNYERTSEALRNGNTAAITQDDLDNLTAIERASQATRFNEQSAGEKVWGSIKDAFTSADSGEKLAFSDRLERFRNQFDQVDSELAKATLENREPYSELGKPTGFAFDYLQSSPEDRLAMRERMFGVQAEALGTVVKNEAELAARPVEPGAARYQELGGDTSAMAQAMVENPGYVARSAISSMATSLPMLAAGAIGGPLAAGVVELGMENDAKLLDVLREAKIDLNNPKEILKALQDDDFMTGARQRAALKAAGTTAVDVIGMGIAGKLIAPARVGGKALSGIQREGINVLAQVPVQGVTGAISEAAGQLAADGEVSGGDILMEAVAGAASSTLEVGTFGGKRLVKNITEGLTEARKSREAAKGLDSMVTAALASKTRQRDPTTFNEVVTNQLRDTPMETITIPAEKLAGLNQDGMPPVLDDLLARVPGLSEQFAEASARGGSVTMNTADYLTAFADHHAELGKSVRVPVEGMSLDEVEVWTSAQEEQIQQYADMMARAPDQTDAAYVDMMGQLVSAGYRQADAEQYTALHVSAIATLAQRTGMDVQELLRRFPLEVRNKAPEALQAIPVDDARIAIGRLRAGDIPQARDMFGKSLGDYLRSVGGLNDEGGELAALDVDVGKKGKNRLTRKGSGLTLDDATMQAWENGYFPGVAREDVNPQMLVDAIDNEIRGKPTYSANFDNPTLRDQAQNLNALQEYLDRLGVDINALSDDEVLNILRNPDSIQSDQQLEQTGAAEKPRGYINFNNPGKGKQRKFQITVTGRRDLSTLLHEFGHFYLEVVADLASDEGAPIQMVNDMAAIREWAGGPTDGPLTVDQHETFARGFERYLAEGKAPNPALQGAFARFKRWIISVYKDLARLNVELSPEIIQVMNRIVATDDQITAAEQATTAVPMFESAAKAGMTEEEFAAYRNQIELAHDDAANQIEQQVIREEDRRRSKWWKEEKARVAEEVAEEVDADPVYAAIKELRSGQIKLNSSQIREEYGLPTLRKLSFMHSKTGLNSDAAAMMLGFRSGDEMVKAILGAPARSLAIETEAQTRMEERHGALTTGESVERAMDAVHNERHGAVLLKELESLAKVGGRKNVTSQTILRKAAQRIMGNRKVRDVHPFEYQRAEAKAGRAAFEAASKGDLATAYQAKQQQLLNWHLWREATKAKEQSASIVDRMAKFNKASKREKLGKAGHDYLDQIDHIMEQYEFRDVSLRQVDRMTSFATWYADQLAAGNEPDVPEFMLNNMNRTNYKNLSVNQLAELDGFARNIDHLAGLKNKLAANQKLRDFEEARGLLTTALYSNLEKRKPLPIDKSTMGWAAVKGQQFGALSASLLKMEQIIEWMDDGDVTGPWHTTFWQPFVEAQIRENDLNRDITGQLMANIDAHRASMGGKALQEKFHIKEINQTFTKNAILSVALNLGNEGNRTKLLKGYGWSEAQLAAILTNMTKADWEFVQAQWNLVESLWPQVEALEISVHGTAPPKVEATPVQTQFGQYSGGYWPIVYDHASAQFANVQNAMADGNGLYDEGAGKATTPRGHTKARVDGFAAPLVLDTGIIANHLQQVVHDLTHRMPIRDAAKLIGDRQIKQAIIDTLGDNIAGQFNPWLRGVANDVTMDQQKGVGQFTKVMDGAAANLSVAWMGFSATTGMQQVFGYSQTYEHLAQIGARKQLLPAMLKFVTHPMDTVRFVNEVSGEMRNRSANLDNNIRQAINRSLGKNDWKSVMQRLAFKHIAVIQAFVDYPTFMAGYQHAIESGEDADAAVRMGDRAVRLTQMAAGAKDLASVQRKGFMKYFTIVYSYFNLLYNREVDLARAFKSAQGVKDYMTAFERTAFLLIIPAVVGPLVMGKGPGDDEDWWSWFALKATTYPLQSVPFVRDFAGAIDSGYGYDGATPIGDVFGAGYKFVKAMGKDDVDALQVTTTTMDVLGMSFGLPVAQPKRAVKYLFGVEDGTAPADDVGDWVKGLLFGPPTKK